MFANAAITSIDRNGFAVAAAVVAVGVQHLPLPLHLLPYPGSGPVGLALIKETGG